MLLAGDDLHVHMHGVTVHACILLNFWDCIGFVAMGNLLLDVLMTGVHPCTHALYSTYRYSHDSLC